MQPLNSLDTSIDRGGEEVITHERRMGGTWKGVDRRVQTSTGRIGPNGCNWIAVLPSDQKGSASEGNNDRGEGGFRQNFSNANFIGSTVPCKKWRTDMTKLKERIASFFHLAEEKRQLNELKNERIHQADRLEKIVRTTIVKAALDGEEKWFLQLVEEDPTCVLRVVDECSSKRKEKNNDQF